MKKLYVIGNWKMNLLPESALALAEALKPKYGKATKSCVVMVAPQFLLVPQVQWALRGMDIEVACQNVAAFKQGAYTGEVSPELMAAMGIKYSLVGHSERRSLFHESDSLVAARAKAALACGIHPIVCIGETLAERESGQHNTKVQSQITAVLEALPSTDWGKILWAYEPVWAIGTGKVAGPEQVAAIHLHISQCLEKFAEKAGVGGSMPPILYGGSVKPENAKGLSALPHVDGFLVGGASLAFESFDGIIQAGIAGAAGQQ